MLGLQKKKKKKERRIDWRLWVKQSDCWEAEKSAPKGFQSTLCTVFNQIYVKGHRYLTGRSAVIETEGEMLKISGNKEWGRGNPMGLWWCAFVQKHFQWLQDASKRPHWVLQQLLTPTDRQQKHEAATYVQSETWSFCSLL